MCKTFQLNKLWRKCVQPQAAKEVSWMSMGMNISAGTIMAYMDLDMSSFNSAIDTVSYTHLTLPTKLEV